MNPRLLIIAAFAACSLVLSVSVDAQEAVSQASVSGRVTDPQGGLVPGAVVTARQTETNLTAETVTDQAGRFRFPYLRVGSYEVKVRVQGFADATRALTLTVGSAFELPVTLAVAGVILWPHNCSQLTVCIVLDVSGDAIGTCHAHYVSVGIARARPGIATRIRARNAEANAFHRPRVIITAVRRETFHRVTMFNAAMPGDTAKRPNNKRLIRIAFEGPIDAFLLHQPRGETLGRAKTTRMLEPLHQGLSSDR